MIYFIQQEISKAIKIGTTEQDITKRLRTIQTGSSEKLILRGVTHGGEREEQILHIRYKKYRLHGEWFQLSEDVILSLLHQETDQVSNTRRVETIDCVDVKQYPQWHRNATPLQKQCQAADEKRRFKYLCSIIILAIILRSCISQSTVESIDTTAAKTTYDKQNLKPVTPIDPFSIESMRRH